MIDPDTEAFAITGTGHSAHQPGLTVRAYFAARAMQGLILRQNTTALVQGGTYHHQHEYQNDDAGLRVLVKDAVLIADSLIAELNKEKPV